MMRKAALFAAFLAFAVLIRAPTFGNPVLEPDEQLYLVVGDRLFHGHWPYVELWDRKPVGLFLFYAGIRALGGSGIMQYQVAAALCAGGTAALIFAIARRQASVFGSLIAAIAYLLLLNPLRGEGGQAPVLYNLATACAAWAAFRANDHSDPRRVLRLALFAMAAMGISIQFKYTPFVEGAFFGLHFLARLRRCGIGTPRLIAAAAAMIAVALAPTILAVSVYAVRGHLDAFVQANFTSVFHRLAFPPKTRTGQRMMVAALSAPLVLAAFAGMARRWKARAGDRGDAILLVGWTVAAVAAFAMLGDIYDFYFITVMLPLSIAAASALGLDLRGIMAAVVLSSWPAIWTLPSTFDTAAFARSTTVLADTVRPYVRDRCLYVYDGPTILYLLTGACAPTRFLYPDHLTNPTEAPALGVDPAAEMARLLATRPGAIVTADAPLVPRVNPATQARMRDALARDYVLAASVPSPTRTYYVWALRMSRPAPRAIEVRHPALPQ